MERKVEIRQRGIGAIVEAQGLMALSTCKKQDCVRTLVVGSAMNAQRMKQSVHPRLPPSSGSCCVPWLMQAGGGQLALYNVPHLQHPGTTATAAAPAVNAGAAPTESSSTAAAESPEPASAAPPTHLPDLGSIITPLGGRLVVFDSLLEHEVLPAFQPRYALTTWFYKACAGTVAASAGAAEDPRAGTLGSTAAGAAASTSDSHDGRLAASELREDGATGRVSQAGGSSATRSTSGRPLHMHDPQKGILQHEESIFVSIVSYRDPETRWTLWDLYRKAAVPERVHVGVVWQV